MHYINSNELTHHGIMGMKWGIRRYQNPDGSLTPEGLARYGNGESVSGSYKKKYTDKTKQEKIKRVVKTAAVVGVAALAGYAAYRFGKSHMSKQAAAKVMKRTVESLPAATKKVTEAATKTAAKTIQNASSTAKKTNIPNLTLNPDVSKSGKNYVDKLLKAQSKLSDINKNSSNMGKAFNEVDELTKEFLRKGFGL